MLSTFLIAAALTTNLTTTTATTTYPTIAANNTECQENCSTDSCSKYLSLTRNCTKLIRDQCHCCTVCLRTENQICGGHLNIHGLCEQDLICYKSNLSDSTGRCVKACFKFQCLRTNINNKITCQCANHRLPCHVNLTENTCDDDSFIQQTRQLTYLKANHDDERIINCSNIVCKTKQLNTSICPSDSHFVQDRTSLIRTSLSSSTNLSSICCESHGQCRCSTCPKTICEENSIIQIFRTGNPNLPGQCCDQFNCITNSKQCHHDQKIYNDNETWSIDLCTTCTCRAGLVDCSMVQCPTYTHCGYMYKPENECCPKCGGCLNDRLHVQHMNSTWIESNGCMRCWCENGRSRCIAEGCIAPPCENPRQIANVCCPVCDDSFDDGSDSQEVESIIVPKISSTTVKCPILDQCSLVCEHGLAKDEQGCLQCTCSTMSCPSPLCTLKFDRLSKQYCSCSSPSHLNCGQLNCDKHCPYNYSINSQTGCPTCECNPCPQLICTKNCTYGLKRNEVGCPICVCESNISSSNQSKVIDILKQSWPKRCHSGLFSYSNGEIWFDGCRQCLCHKGEQLCALISCPTPKCSQPVLLPNRCCPSCPEMVMLPEPIPSSQVCYASQYVTGEELEFDKCTKCLCLHNIAFCSVALCPPLACSSPIYDDSLCCPVCPPKQSDKLISIDGILNVNDDICILDNGHMKHAGELWKHDDCQSCHCPRGGGGQIECFSQTCEQNLPCSNPILKKGQCCPVCLPPTAAVAVCIFNHVQYRSGEHWNVSECHSCECSYGTIVCHQHQCPSLTCVHTVTLTGHCCPICHDQLTPIYDQNRFPSMKSHIGLTILIIFSILIFILIFVILILICILLRGGRHQSLNPSSQLPTVHHRSPIMSSRSLGNNSKSTNLFSYIKYDLISRTNNNQKSDLLSSSHIPLSSLEQASTHSFIGTTTTTTTTATSSSNHELEPGTWTEDDPMLHCSVSTSNDDEDDDDIEHETLSNDNDESRQQQQQQQQQISPNQMQMAGGPPTIIYV